MTGPIILLGLVLSFQTSPTLCSNSTVCQRTTSDKWTHEPKMAIFAKMPNPHPGYLGGIGVTLGKQVAIPILLGPNYSNILG